MKQSRDLMILQMEIAIIEVVITYNSISSVDLTTGYQSRLGTNLTQVVQQIASLLPTDALHLDRSVCKIAGFSIIRKCKVSH